MDKIFLFKRLANTEEDFATRNLVFEKCFERFLKSPIAGPDKESFNQEFLAKKIDDIVYLHPFILTWLGNWEKSAEQKTCPPNSHNVFMQMLIDGGIIALIAFLWLFFEAVRGV